jgi:DNA mismatch repair protein MutS
MTETANILHHATAKSLVILDEIGRGTSTFDGLSIAWAVAEQLHDRVRARTLFATHYHELLKLADDKPRVKNCSVAVKEHAGKVVFLRKLIAEGASRSYGIEVAKLAGLPHEVLARAREVLAELESGDSRLIDGAQLRLFPKEAAAIPNPVKEQILSELAAFSVDSSSPLEALNLLAKWKKELSE